MFKRVPSIALRSMRSAPITPRITPVLSSISPNTPVAIPSQRRLYHEKDKLTTLPSFISINNNQKLTYDTLLDHYSNPRNGTYSHNPTLPHTQPNPTLQRYTKPKPKTKLTKNLNPNSRLPNQNRRRRRHGTRRRARLRRRDETADPRGQGYRQDQRRQVQDLWLWLRDCEL